MVRTGMSSGSLKMRCIGPAPSPARYDLAQNLEFEESNASMRTTASDYLCHQVAVGRRCAELREPKIDRRLV